MIPPRSVMLLVLLSAMGMLLFALGCNEDPTFPCSSLPGGRLQGEVLTGGLPSETMVMATQVIDGALSEFTFETPTDAAGEYILDLPVGHYIVQVRPGRDHRYIYDYSTEGLGYGQISPDTLRIDDSVSPVTVDFSLGSMTLLVLLSDYPDGENVGFQLYKRDAVETGEWRTYLDQGWANIENGRADIQAVGLLPGQYRVQIKLSNYDNLCSCSYDGENFWMPGVRDESESPWYEVAGDSVTSLTFSITSEPARMEGRISGAWLSMGLDSSPYLSIVNADSVTIMGRRQVYDDGGFGFNIYLPEPVKVLVEQGSIRQWIGGPGYDEATVYDLRLGETITNVDLVQSGLRLNIVGEEMDNIFGTYIHIHDPVDLELLATANQWQGNGGIVPVPNLWPGDYILNLTPSRYEMGDEVWRPQWFDRVVDPADAQVVSINSFGEVVRLDIVLERGGSISGQLEFSSSADGWYWVIVTPADQYFAWGGDYSFGESYNFVIQGIPDGRYKIGVLSSDSSWSPGTPPPEGTLWYPGTGDWDEAAVLDIIDASDHVDLIILVN